MKHNIYAGCDNAVLVKQDPIDSVRIVEFGDDSTGTPCFKRQSDVYLLFHQEKLIERLGVETLRSWIDNLNAQSSSIDYSKFTDDQLLKFVKSRYIQSPSELQNWSQYLMDQHSNLRESFDEYLHTLGKNAETSAAPTEE